MMKVLIPTDKDFDYKECKKMYEDNQRFVCDNSLFDEVIKNTFFYSFYDKDKLSLCIYFYEKEEKLWVNGYGIRKNYLFNKQCFKTALDWFNCDIWAKSNSKPAIYGLLACGFKRYKDNIFMYKQLEI